MAHMNPLISEFGGLPPFTEIWRSNTRMGGFRKTRKGALKSKLFPFAAASYANGMGSSHLVRSRGQNSILPHFFLGGFHG